MRELREHLAGPHGDDPHAVRQGVAHFHFDLALVAAPERRVKRLADALHRAHHETAAFAGCRKARELGVALGDLRFGFECLQACLEQERFFLEPRERLRRRGGLCGLGRGGRRRVRLWSGCLCWRCGRLLLLREASVRDSRLRDVRLRTRGARARKGGGNGRGRRAERGRQRQRQARQRQESRSRADGARVLVPDRSKNISSHRRLLRWTTFRPDKSGVAAARRAHRARARCLPGKGRPDRQRGARRARWAAAGVE